MRVVFRERRGPIELMLRLVFAVLVIGLVLGIVTRALQIVMIFAPAVIGVLLTGWGVLAALGMIIWTRELRRSGTAQSWPVPLDAQLWPLRGFKADVEGTFVSLWRQAFPRKQSPDR